MCLKWSLHAAGDSYIMLGNESNEVTMKAIVLIVALSGLVLAAATPGAARASDGQERAQNAGASLIGTAGPDMRLKTIDGAEINLASLYGKKPIYIKFWATWCVPCRQQMPHFEKTFERLNKDMAVIAVNVGFNDTVADIRAYRQELGLKMPVVLDDGRLADVLHLRVTPTHVIIGRDGKVLYIGHLVNSNLEEALAAAQAEHPSVIRTALQGTATTGDRGAKDDVRDLTIRGMDGSMIPAADPSGKQRTLLVFLSPWCESYLAKSRPQRSQECRKARLATEQLAQSERDVRVLGIASGLWAEAADLVEYRKENRISIPLALDETGDLFRRFGVTEVPVFIVVDASGHISARIDRVTDGLQTAVRGAR